MCLWSCLHILDAVNIHVCVCVCALLPPPPLLSEIVNTLLTRDLHVLMTTCACWSSFAQIYVVYICMLLVWVSCRVCITVCSPSWAGAPACRGGSEVCLLIHVRMLEDNIHRALLSGQRPQHLHFVYIFVKSVYQTLWVRTAACCWKPDWEQSWGWKSETMIHLCCVVILCGLITTSSNLFRITHTHLSHG